MTGIAILAISTAVGAQDATPDLTGVWSGTVEAGVSQGRQEHEPDVVEPTFGNYELTFTRVIERQDGRAIVGSNNTHLILVDEDSYFNGLLLSPNSMEMCLAETHADAMGVWCLLMERQET